MRKKERGKWVSIYFEKEEFELLEKVRRTIEQRRGSPISNYKLLKEWVMEKLNSYKDVKEPA